MKNIKTIYTVFAAMLLLTACDNDLEQSPELDLEASKLVEFEPVLNAAYYYQTGVAMPQLVMGDFRADNMLMLENPHTSIDTYDSDLGGGDMAGAFFSPVYSNLYKAILSANNVIENSLDDTQINEAKFLRGLSYFKLVMIFGDVSVILTPQPSVSEIPDVDLTRQPVADVYNNVIIPDLQDAIAGLTNSGLATGRASQIAAKAFLGKVYMYRGDFANAATMLAEVLSDAVVEGVTLEPNFADVVSDVSSEIIFATQLSSSIPNADGTSSSSTFVGWFAGNDTKSLTPLDPRLTAAFDASSAAGGGTDLRKSLTIDAAGGKGVKYTGGNSDQDFIEMRLSDVILMYAEALNESTNATGAKSATILAGLDAIRARAGLTSLVGTATTQADVETAIQKERRVELALEGHRWFDLVRTGTVDAEMGQTISSNYYVFPIPSTEITATNGIITQNTGY
ncbi:RagB/SusD family nutrient uptake outer membrane protein [Algibacter lectus]|uniref:RagB/SusD family nutrient uptake outer membrane protein n=1 Tax=Algibacter lectus TaxID=221126 RepID=UPI0009DD0D94|nr:RagB/SusD family nutrient uptake outer membrane protein [Algibacter lectus]